MRDISRVQVQTDIHVIVFTADEETCLTVWKRYEGFVHGKQTNITEECETVNPMLQKQSCHLTMKRYECVVFSFGDFFLEELSLLYNYLRFLSVIIIWSEHLFL